MAELKIKKADASVEDFLNTIKDEQTRQGCLYIKKLKDVDTKVLKELVNESVKTMKEA